MASIRAVKSDDVLWVSKRMRMGNTTVMRAYWYQMRVIAVDLDKLRVWASWNGNPPQWYFERSVKTWRRNKPTKKVAFGNV